MDPWKLWLLVSLVAVVACMCLTDWWRMGGEE
jgi:hypothetical protein